MTDSADEQLWYAVSANLVDGGIVGAVNAGLRGTPPVQWLNVCDEQGALISDRVAAVIIAPGTVQDAQDRDGSNDPADYLESYAVGSKTFDNSDSDGQPDASGCATAGEDFILVTGTDHDGFNDKLTFITIDELMTLVQQRVIGEVANLLEAHKQNHGAYPWLSPFQSRVVRAEGAASFGSSATTLQDTGSNLRERWCHRQRHRAQSHRRLPRRGHRAHRDEHHRRRPARRQRQLLRRRRPVRDSARLRGQRGHPRGPPCRFTSRIRPSPAASP